MGKTSKAFIFFMAIILLFPSLSCPEEAKKDTQLYSNNEFHFSFKYPVSWHEQPPATPSSVAKVVSPSDNPCAECAITFKKMSMLDNFSQEDLNALLLQSPPTKEEYRAALSQGFSEVTVIDVSQGFLGSRVAHLIRAKYSITSGSAKQYISIRTAKGFSPGYSWTFNCGGKGNSAAEAESAYEYWQWAIDKMFFSFNFD